MTPEIARERVARGAALLDEQRPGWWREINLEKLDISCEACVLGQVFGRFLDGTQELGIFGRAFHFGFNALDYPSEGSDVWGLLSNAWLAVIAQRLVAEPDAPVVTWTAREYAVTE